MSIRISWHHFEFKFNFQKPQKRSSILWNLILSISDSFISICQLRPFCYMLSVVLYYELVKSRIYPLISAWLHKQGIIKIDKKHHRNHHCHIFASIIFFTLDNLRLYTCHLPIFKILVTCKISFLEGHTNHWCFIIFQLFLFSEWLHSKIINTGGQEILRGDR